ncbi:MAG: hypothetical protein R3F65_00375 [bacterium]
MAPTRGARHADDDASDSALAPLDAIGELTELGPPDEPDPFADLDAFDDIGDLSASDAAPDDSPRWRADEDDDLEWDDALAAALDATDAVDPHGHTGALPHGAPVRPPHPAATPLHPPRPRPPAADARGALPDDDDLEWSAGLDGDAEALEWALDDDDALEWDPALDDDDALEWDPALDDDEASHALPADAASPDAPARPAPPAAARPTDITSRDAPARTAPPAAPAPAAARPTLRASAPTEADGDQAFADETSWDAALADALIGGVAAPPDGIEAFADGPSWDAALDDDALIGAGAPAETVDGIAALPEHTPWDAALDDDALIGDAAAHTTARGAGASAAAADLTPDDMAGRAAFAGREPIREASVAAAEQIARPDLTPWTAPFDDEDPIGGALPDDASWDAALDEDDPIGDASLPTVSAGIAAKNGRTGGEPTPDFTRGRGPVLDAEQRGAAPMTKQSVGGAAPNDIAALGDDAWDDDLDADALIGDATAARDGIDAALGDGSWDARDADALIGGATAAGIDLALGDDAWDDDLDASDGIRALGDDAWDDDLDADALIGGATASADAAPAGIDPALGGAWRDLDADALIGDSPDPARVGAAAVSPPAAAAAPPAARARPSAPLLAAVSPAGRARPSAPLLPAGPPGDRARPDAAAAAPAGSPSVRPLPEAPSSPAPTAARHPERDPRDPPELPPANIREALGRAGVRGVAAPAEPRWTGEQLPGLSRDMLDALTATTEPARTTGGGAADRGWLDEPWDADPWADAALAAPVLAAPSAAPEPRGGRSPVAGRPGRSAGEPLPDPPGHPVIALEEALATRDGRLHLQTADLAPRAAIVRRAVYRDGRLIAWHDLDYEALIGDAGIAREPAQVPARVEALHEAARRALVERGLAGLDWPARPREAR